MRRISIRATLAVAVFAGVAGDVFGAGGVDAAENAELLRERGALFYVPFEGTPDAAIALGRSAPSAQKALSYVPGRVGQAVSVTNRLGKHGSSMLVYEALGNIYNRRGTIAFWVQSPWDGTDRDILTGSAYTGPAILSIAAEELNRYFLWFCRRKSFFDMRFDGRRRSGETERFGTFCTRLVPLWEANEWQHFAFTWDDRWGCAVYRNGEILFETRGEIEWDMTTPANIGLGHSPLRAGDLWPVTSDFLFDEFIILSRPLAPTEIAPVMAGRYGELRLSGTGDWPFDAERRRRAFGLTRGTGRPVAEGMPGEGARVSLEQVAVERVAMKFHNRYTLVDDQPGTGVHFKDGGLDFDIPAVFEFAKPHTLNLVVTAASDPNGAQAFEQSPKAPLADLGQGHCYLPVPERERGSFGVFFPGGSTAQDVRFFRTGAGPLAARQGTRHPLMGTVSPEECGEAARVMLRALHPADRSAVLASTANASAPTPAFRVRRSALARTFFVLAPGATDRFVDTLRLVLDLMPAASTFSVAIRVHDPEIARRTVFSMEFDVIWPAGDAAQPLDVAIRPVGLIVPAGRRLVVELVSDTDLVLHGGGESVSRIELGDGDAKRIGHEFATAQLRLIWPAFLRRLNQNRFVRPGEDRERNPIWVGLNRAERYDPENEHLQAWWGWSRLRPWPKRDFSDLDAQPGPPWAVYTRAAVQSLQASIHWWLENRSNADAYLVGGGNQWNDITKLYNKYLCLGGITSDQRLVDAVERYLDAHWNTGRMIHGYIYYMTDITHSVEEANYIQPSLHVLRPGKPRHLYRDLLTASNYQKWMGTNARGHTHFRSNFFNAARMELEGVHGRDKAGCAAATVPGRMLWWYNGHPPTAHLLRNWADAWLDDTRREADGKPANVVPGAVQFETDELSAPNSYTTLIGEHFLATAQLTDNDAYLEPIRQLVRAVPEPGTRFPSGYARAILGMLSLTGETKLSPHWTAHSAERIQSFRDDFFYQRGIETYEGTGALGWVTERKQEDLLELLKYVIRNNERSMFAYCDTDPPTDRVYPWGRVVLPVVMLGGRLFDGRASDPLPTAAFVWDGIDPDVVSLVVARKPTELTMVVYNFKSEPVQAGIRVMQLPEGRYRIATAPDSDGDVAPEGECSVHETDLRRFTAAPLEIPPRTPLRVELRLLEPRAKKLRPDLAVALAGLLPEDEGVTARVHNLGCVPATGVTVGLIDAQGKKLAVVGLGSLPGLTGYEPQFRDVVLKPEHIVDLAATRLVVDAANSIDEINESNNDYAVRLGVPMPVESGPKKR